MMGITANDIMKRALVKMGVLSPGEALSAPISAQVFSELNDMLESWALEKLLVYASVLENFTLTAGQTEYTYGAGGNFDSTRPIKIRDDTFIRSGTIDRKVKKITLDVYRRQIGKSNQSTPQFFAVNPEYPKLKVLFYPTPSAADSIYFRVWKQLVKFVDKTTEVDLPPGYARAIISNLAIEVSPNFGKKISESLAALSFVAKKNIKMVNATPVKGMSSDLGDLIGVECRSSIILGPWG